MGYRRASLLPPVCATWNPVPARRLPAADRCCRCKTSFARRVTPHHYLAIFDRGRAIGLCHTTRLASPGQRIALYAKDRGHSHLACNVSGYYCEVHHVTDYAICRETDINDLTLACGGHHPRVKPGGWITRKRANGDTEWIPPPHLDYSQPRTNNFHHPEKLLYGNDGEGDEH
jgi:hypothetical protein